MNYELKICKQKSKEKGTIYSALVVDLGYKRHYISANLTEIAEFLNLTSLQVYDIVNKLDVGNELKVGSVNLLKVL